MCLLCDGKHVHGSWPESYLLLLMLRGLRDSKIEGWRVACLLPGRVSPVLVLLQLRLPVFTPEVAG
jgi:hypothetical protein